MQGRLEAAASCGADGDAYIIINGAEAHTDAVGEVYANNNDPLDVFCGGFLCNGHAVAPAMSCVATENAHATIVGGFLRYQSSYFYINFLQYDYIQMRGKKII